MKFSISQSFLCLFVAAAITMSMACTSSASAQVEQKIAIVDIQQMMRESKAAQSIQKQISTLREKYKTEIAAEEKGLRDAEKAIIAKKSSMTAEEFQKERKAFEGKLGKVQKNVRSKQEKLDKAFNKAIEKVRVKGVEIVAGLAEETGASIVLPRQNVIIIDKSLDLTDEAMTRLNAALKDVKVKVE